MRKSLLVFAIGVFVACNSNVTSAEKAVDSSANATIDSLKNVSDSAGYASDSTRIR